MTEQEWFASDDPSAMIDLLRKRQVGRTKVGKRRLRQFCCACVRRTGYTFDEEERRALEVAERFNDDLADRNELEQAYDECMNAAWKQPFSRADYCTGWALRCCTSPRNLTWHAQTCAYQTAIVVGDRKTVALHQEAEIGWLGGGVMAAAERIAQAGLLRCLFGNPFQAPANRTFSREARSLAQACREGDAGVYPILADALADLGEEAAATHCRQAGHVKGCHVVDWVLGRA